jgi:hypothetical protein
MAWYSHGISSQMRLAGTVRQTLLAAGKAATLLRQMTKRSHFRYFKTSLEIIRLAVMLYVRFPLSLRNVDDILHERGIDISHETVSFGGTVSVRCLPRKFGEVGSAGCAHTRTGNGTWMRFL